MNKKNTTNRFQRVTKLIVTGAIVAAPFLSVLPNAEAQPRWNQGGWNQGNQGGWNNGQTTISGVVTRDLAGDAFELRTDNGRVIRVNVGRNDEPRSLDRGDRVRVTGHVRNGVFVARDIDLIRDTGNNNNGGYGQTTLTGVVARDLAGDSFELRTDSGRVVRVNVGRDDEPRSLDRGDRVRVTGRFTNNVFLARDIDFLRDTDNNNDSQTTLTGIVTRDLVGDSFELKTDSGRTVWVRLGRNDEPRSLDRGDRVRVTGRFTGNSFIARDLDFLRDRR